MSGNAPAWLAAVDRDTLTVRLPSDRRSGYSSRGAPDSRVRTFDSVVARVTSLFVRVMAYTGMRWGEATAVRVRRIDLMKRRIEVVHTAVEIGGEMSYGTPKTHQCRSVPVPRSLTDALVEHVVGKRPDDLVFTTPRGDVMRNHNFRSRVSFRRRNASAYLA
jgi:integrase